MAFQRRKPAAIGVKAPYPGFIEPELATSVDKVPSGDRWIHEIKFDGYRVQVFTSTATTFGNCRCASARRFSKSSWPIRISSVESVKRDFPPIGFMLFGRQITQNSDRIS